jgi:hypothetical protein
METMTPHDEEEIMKWLDELEKQPIAIRKEQSSETLAMRKAAARKIAVLNKERDELITKLQMNLTEKEENCKKLRAALDIATDEWEKAKAVMSSESRQLDNEICYHEAVLIETADRYINEVITFFRDKVAYYRTPAQMSFHKLFPEKVESEGNYKAINPALQYCLAAIKELERMKLTPALDIQKIEKMKKAIPKIDVYIEVNGVGLSPELKGVNATTLLESEDRNVLNLANLLESESQMDWEIEILNERLKKIMRK